METHCAHCGRSYVCASKPRWVFDDAYRLLGTMHAGCVGRRRYWAIDAAETPAAEAQFTLWCWHENRGARNVAEVSQRRAEFADAGLPSVGPLTAAEGGERDGSKRAHTEGRWELHLHRLRRTLGGL